MSPNFRAKKGHYLVGGTIEREATFIQVKWDLRQPPRWKLEQHQRIFWRDINTNEFTFGKKVFKNIGYIPILFKGIKETGRLCRYLFVNPTICNKYFGWLIKLKKIQGEKVFNRNELLFNARQFFEKELINILNGDGEKVIDELLVILNIIYKYMKWEEDPPEEFGTYFQGDGGFSIIEISILEKEHF